jgi:hypothetical protein
MSEEVGHVTPLTIGLVLTEALAINLLLTFVEKRLLSPEEARGMVRDAAEDQRLMIKGTLGAGLAKTVAGRLEAIASRFAVAEKPN